MNFVINKDSNIIDKFTDATNNFFIFIKYGKNKI